VRVAIKIYLCLVLLGLAGQSFAGQKFSSLFEFNQRQKNHIVLDMPWLEPVVFQGYLNAGGVESNSSSPHYYDTGLGAAGPAIQILAQAIGSKSARNRKYAKAQAEADLILSEHSGLVRAISHESLYFQLKQQALTAEHTLEVFTPEKKGVKYFVKLSPIFTISQDKSSIMLNSKLRIHSKKRPKKPVFTQDFIVVSEPIGTDQIDEFWQPDNQQNFVDLSENLFSKSVDLMLAAMANEPVLVGKQRTFKYEFGNENRFERATQARYPNVNSACDRTIVTTLANNLMSLPFVSESCVSGLLD
jgi:hypothetical protein